MYKRNEYQIIRKRIEEQRKFIQVIMGPRQVGKSTVVKQVLKDCEMPYQFFSADNVPTSDNTWISTCWDGVRSIYENNKSKSILLVIDEIQKIKNWSEAYYRLFPNYFIRKSPIQQTFLC